MRHGDVMLLIKLIVVTELFAKQEAHHKVGLGETPRRLIRKLCRYSSLDKFEDAFDAAVHCPCRISHHFRIKNPFLHFGPVLRTFL